MVLEGKNEFEFTFPTSKIPITFKFLTQGDEEKIEKEVEGLKKINKELANSTLRLKHIIMSVNGNYDLKSIREFIDNDLLARDARALRNYINEILPGINMKVDIEFYDGYVQEGVELPIGLNFFWPDAAV